MRLANRLMMTSMMAAALALPLAAGAQQDNSIHGNGINGERSSQSQGQSSAVHKGPTGSNGLGQTGTDRQEDIRRTATGELSLSQDQVAGIRTAVNKAHLKRQDHVSFTIAVGAAVPQQAHARDLPKAVSKVLPVEHKLQYVLVRDRLILLDKDTRRIVAIVPGVA